MTEVQATLPVPGVGARRKGPKTLPRLPASAFSPPNSSASEQFPLPQSPSIAHPTYVIDSNLLARDGLPAWNPSVGRITAREVKGVVLALSADSQPAVVDQFVENHPSLDVLSILVPVNLDRGPLTEVPTFKTTAPVSFLVRFVKNSPELVEGVKWALERGHVVEIDVQVPLNGQELGWEGLEELLTAVLGSGEDDTQSIAKGIVVLSNVLPPPLDFDISIVKLLTHPTYQLFQARIASLSLFPSLYVKYVPSKTGPLPPATRNASTEETKERMEWKRRITMYLGPAVEAFGYQRILYGSSTGTSEGDTGDWYDISRESLAAIGVDQDGLDAVFGLNTSVAYRV